MVNIIKYSSIRGNKKTADGRSKKEVKRRIVLAKSAFHEMSRVLKSRNTVKFRKALFEGLIFGGAYIRRGLSTEGNLRFKALSWKEIYCFGFVFTLYLN